MLAENAALVFGQKLNGDMSRIGEIKLTPRTVLRKYLIIILFQGYLACINLGKVDVVERKAIREGKKTT